MSTKICLAFKSMFAARRTIAPAGPNLNSRHCQSKPASARPRPQPPKKLDRRIVPDSKWPGMFRIRRPDGSLSDMANLTRIKDALRSMDAKS
jgi:hypothetical protein